MPRQTKMQNKFIIHTIRSDMEMHDSRTSWDDNDNGKYVDISF